MTYQIVNLYDSNYRTYDKWYDDNKFAYLSELEVLKRVMPKKGGGLEIGVGTGRFAALEGSQITFISFTGTVKDAIAHVLEDITGKP